MKRDSLNFDSLYSKLPPEVKQRVMKAAVSEAQTASVDLEFKGDYSEALNRNDRLHMIEAINKVTLSLSCLIFFFIGAPWEPLSGRADWVYLSSSPYWSLSSIISSRTLV